MSLGGMLPLDNLSDVTHGSVTVDGPISGGAGLDLTGTSAAGVHVGNVSAGGDLNVVDHSAHLGIDPGTGQSIGVGVPGSDGSPADVSLGGAGLPDVGGVTGTVGGLTGNLTGTLGL
ncbi:MAG: hypothetical protein WCA46_31145 [Actinocatenispora sp.]